MTDFLGAPVLDLLAPPIPGTAREAYTWAAQMTGFGVLVDDPLALAPAVGGTFSNTGGKSDFGGTEYLGEQGDMTTMAIDWFERFHVIPRAFSFGNILSTQVAAIEVYNAFRHAAHYWTTFVNNAGAGVTLSGMPSLPALIPAQSGIQMTLQVSTSGSPRVDTTLDFGFDTSVTIYVPIILQRIVLLHVEPEEGVYREFLQFLTDVIPHMDQTEQRARLRKCPRQFFDWEVFLEDGRERARVENILFDWQGQVFGVPVWHELRHTTVAHSSGVTVVTVPSTADADYRDGGLFLVYLDQDTYDVLELASHTGTTLTATTATINSYPIGTAVMPLRTALSPSRVPGTRWRVNGSKLQIRFQVDDNNCNIASAAGWPTFNGKILLSDPNVVEGELSESYDREVIELDSVTGLVNQQPTADRGRRVSRKTFWAGNQAALWRVRQLMHHLGGRQTSHYLPTFYKDLELAVDLASGSNVMVVVNVGYSQFVRNRQAKNTIRVLLNDGTALLRTITASSPTSPAVETLTVDATWPSNILISDVARIDYVEKVRADSDMIEIQHARGGVVARVSYPVRTVLE